MINILNLKLKHVEITFADTYQDVLDLVDNPSKYGKYYSHVWKTYKFIGLIMNIHKYGKLKS